MGSSYVDRDDTVVKGDDGTSDGVKITSTTISSKKCLDVAVSNTVPISTSETESATFVVYAQDIAIGNNKSMLSILNATGSGVKIRVREVRIINVQNTAVTGVIADYRFLRITGHSAGTSLTPQSHDTDDALNVNVTARTGATITGELSPVLRRWQFSTDEWGVGSSDVESNTHDMQIQNSLFDTAPKTKTITINAGQGIHIKQVTNSTVGTFDILIVFTQESA